MEVIRVFKGVVMIVARLTGCNGSYWGSQGCFYDSRSLTDSSGSYWSFQECFRDFGEREFKKDPASSTGVQAGMQAVRSGLI